MDVLGCCFSLSSFLVYFISDDLPVGWVYGNWKDSIFLKVSCQSVRYHHSSQRFSLTIFWDKPSLATSLSGFPLLDVVGSNPNLMLEAHIIRTPGVFLQARVYWKIVSIWLSLAQVYIITKKDFGMLQEWIHRVCPQKSTFSLIIALKFEKIIKIQENI